MKEFIMKHPWIALLGVVVVSDAAVRITKMNCMTRIGINGLVSACVNAGEKEKEETTNESSGDIQKCDESSK